MLGRSIVPNVLSGILFVSSLGLAGCSKSVVHEAGKFSQTEPEPGASPEPSPTPSPSPAPLGCDPARLGELVDYRLLVKSDVKLENISINGRVAATDAEMNDAIIGGALASNPTRTDLAAAETLILSGVKVPNGQVTYGKSLDKSHSRALGGFVNAPLDLAPFFAKISTFSKACSNTKPNTKTFRECRKNTVSPEACTLTIRGNAGLNIANVTPAELLNVTAFVIDIPKGTQLVTNLSENPFAIFRGVSVKFSSRAAEGVSPCLVFWNFKNAESLEFSQTKFRGVVIAPEAKTTVKEQSGEAGFWVREIAGFDSNW